MFSMYFLAAAKPLTKSFTLDEQGEIEKHSYPIVKNFTSIEEHISTLNDVYNAVVKHSKLGHCLIKGKIKDAIDNESRANFTNTNDETWWTLIDLDSSPHDSPEAFMQAHEALANVSYIVQYSSSYGVFKDNKLSCHIYVLLDKPVRAPILKAWLQELNLANKIDRDALQLSRAKASLHYPIDITTCQNDKLIYIAPPILGKGVKCSVTDKERIQFINKPQKTLSHKTFANVKPEAVKKECREILNDLRKREGFTPLRSQTKWVGEYEVQPKPGVAQITEMKVDEDFVRFNLNGGDSWAYYHPINNFELIHSFKDPDIKYLTKELLPEYYKDCVAERMEENASPTEDGELLLAFRDFKSSAYWNGTWNPEKHELNLVRAKDITQLSHFLMSKGRELGEYVPIWDMRFEPDKNFVIDEENHRINTYVPSIYMRDNKYKAPKDWRAECPTIYKVLMSAVSGNKDDEFLEHFLNWLAVIYQKRIKLITAWILTGKEGTGKGVLINHIIAPTLGHDYVPIKRGTELEEKFNGWMENALIAYIDEIQVGNSTRSEAIMADLKQFITDPSPTVRNMREMAYKIINYVNFILSSNKPDPVVITESDRRFNTGVFQSEKLLGITSHTLDHVLPKELHAFVNYMMTRKADVDLANTILHNNTRQNIIEASRTSLDEVGIQLMNGDFEGLWNSMPDLNLMAELHGPASATAIAFANIMKREALHIHQYKNKTRKVNGRDIPVKKGMVASHSKLTRDDMFVVFEHCVGNMPSTPNKFTSLLRHRNIVIEPIRVDEKLVRGIHVEWYMPEARLMEIIREIDDKPKLKVVQSNNVKKAKVA
jgi:hypothetical protein